MRTLKKQQSTVTLTKIQFTKAVERILWVGNKIISEKFKACNVVKNTNNEIGKDALSELSNKNNDS